MKKYLLCFFFCGFLANNVQAQSFLKKIAKTVDKMSNNIEDVTSTIETVTSRIGEVNSSINNKKNKTQSKDKDVVWQNSNTIQKGNIQILNTNPKSMRISLTGGAIVTDVSLIPPADNKKYVCSVLMSNYKWTVNSLRDLQQLSNKLCYGEVLFFGQGSKQTFSVDVPLEMDKMPGKGDHLYVQAFVVDMTNAEIVGQGSLTLVDEEKIRNSLPTAGSIENDLKKEIIGGMIESILGGGAEDSSGDSDGKVCPDCNGSGVCHSCGGKRVDRDGDQCFHCIGKGTCYRCGGTGKIVGFMGF